MCRGHAQYSALFPTPSSVPDTQFCSRLFKSGSWAFQSLWIFCPESAPTVHAQLFLAPYNLFAFCHMRGVSRCNHHSERFQVPACLTYIKWDIWAQMWTWTEGKWCKEKVGKLRIQEAKREAWTNSLSYPFQGSVLPTSSFWTSSLQNCEINKQIV